MSASNTVPDDTEELVARVRERYGRIATGGEPGCCGSGKEGAALSIGYGRQELDAVPEESNLGLGCGAPIAHLDLRPGETVLDLGSGAGFDAFLAAGKVGSGGRVIGVDMTPAMLEQAGRNAAEGGFDNVEFRQGRLEALPVDDATVDAVTSNCVINLVPDKAAAFREIARVLRPGGRVVISDILLDGRLPEEVSRDLLAYVGCIAGALDRQGYFALVEAAGLTGVSIINDIDYLSSSGYAISPDLRLLLERSGVRLDDFAGRVRSVTFRAVKPGATRA
jgi:arsenite methyltransferase